jgi:phenylalanyl-tRNA synthetase beta chain
VGFARELAAILGRPLRPPSTERADVALATAGGTPHPVAIEDAAGCRRYVAVRLDGIAPAATPVALRLRLAALGQRSRGLLVDLTNLAMLEQGQPLHAFDVRDLREGRMVVRAAREGERIRTLDGVDRALEPGDLVIADGDRAVALAGVMGAESSEVRDDTASIVLESASFDPARIRRTASRLGLRTEASQRFEKSLDPEAASAAARRFVEMAIQHLPGVRVAAPATDVRTRPAARVTIALPVDLPRRRLGGRVLESEVRGALRALGFDAQEEGDLLRVTVPTWRATRDVSRPEDLVEEIGRIRGYDRILPIAPVAAMQAVRLTPAQSLDRRVGVVLSLDLGYAETKSHAFYGPTDARRLGVEDVPHVAIRNPTNAEEDRLILTTAAALLRAAKTNQARVARGRVWERTRLVRPAPKPGEGEIAVAGLLAWDRDAGDDAKGSLFLGFLEDVRALLERAGAGRVRARDARDDDALAEGLPRACWLHPGRRAALSAGDGLVALAGEVAPSVLRAYGLEGRVAWGEVRLDALASACERTEVEYRPLLRFPVVPFDVAVIVPEGTSAAEVVDTIERAAPESVRDVRVFDVYAGEGIPPGHRSLALRMELFDPERTLDAASADRLRTAVRTALESRGWTVRAGA